MVESPVPVAGARISTVVPGTARSEECPDRALTNLDLAVKLHYIRGVYLFEGVDRRDGDVDRKRPSPALRVEELKKPMFALLDRFFTAAGRVRIADEEDLAGAGRPYIKCNDAGVRIVEAVEEKTVDEWVSAREECGHVAGDDCHGGLCYEQFLGPDLGFSPLVYLQFTSFKCGGFSLGLSWAHLLGDVLSATAFINTLAQIMAGRHVPHKPSHVPTLEQPSVDPTRTTSKKPASLKPVETGKNRWIPTVDDRHVMTTHSFRITSAQLNPLISTVSPFEAISAVIWKSLTSMRRRVGSQLATVCRHAPPVEVPSNDGVTVGTVEVDVLGSDVAELALRIKRKTLIENGAIGNVDGTADYQLYGANLTFVDLESADVYNLEVKGLRPVFASYDISGVGEEGLVLVLPSVPRHGDASGRMVTVVLPRDELGPLKDELERFWRDISQVCK